MRSRAIQHGATKKTPALVCGKGSRQSQKTMKRKKLFDYPAAMRCHNSADCPPRLAERGVYVRVHVCLVLHSCSSLSPLSRLVASHENCYISESLLTSGLWLQQLMESFPPARLAHSFDSANQLAVPADYSIKSSFHFVRSFSFFFFRCFLQPPSPAVHTARGALRLR